MKRATLGAVARSVVGRALALGLVSALVIALRVFQRGEAFSPRTALLIALFAGGGFAGGLIAFGTVRLLLGWAPRTLRFVAGAALAGPAAIGVTYAAFALTRFLTQSELEAEDAHHSWRHEIVGQAIDSLGFFVTTGAPYLLPWTSPVIALAGACLAFLAQDRASSRLRVPRP